MAAAGARRPDAAGPVPRRGVACGGVVDTAIERTQFILSFRRPKAFKDHVGEELHSAGSGWMHATFPKARFNLVNFCYIGSRTLKDGTVTSRFFLSVENLRQADSLVSHRHILKGSDCCLFDVLTKDEQRAHSSLKRRFHEAQAQGHRVQFQQARLYIDGVEERLAV
jgi:hypothetical protein